MPLLTEAEHLATCGNPMGRVLDVSPPFDFWPYFDAIPPTDFAGADCSAGEVRYIWRDPTGRFEHVHVSSDDPDIFMVLVLDREAGAVHGHRLLDFKHEYGLR